MAAAVRILSGVVHGQSALGLLTVRGATQTRPCPKPQKRCSTNCTQVDIFKLQHKKGDLFSCAPSESLAHCISLDCHMGKGIAVIFKKKFGQVDELKKQCAGKSPGSLAVLNSDKRYIYYLLTKSKYHQKPTYSTLENSLVHMKSHIMEYGVTAISMPLIGCGLDRLQWPRVEDMIKQVFADVPIVITIYTL